MTEREWREMLSAHVESIAVRLESLERRIEVLESHAATVAEVLAHTEQMISEWEATLPMLREIRLGERRGRGNQ